MAKVRGIFLIFLSWPLLTGCYIKAAIEQLTDPTKIITRSATAEVNSASEPHEFTAGNYQVSHAIGNFTAKIETKTTDGYLVFMNVHGSIFSEDIQE